MGGAETEVTVESSRGGKAKTDACRVVRAVNRMTKDEAAKAGVDNHRLYFKTFNDKANLQPPADKSDWFKLVSVDLGNGPLNGPGDSVGVVTQWEWPDPLAGLTVADFDKVAAVIRPGRWRENPQAGAWVGKAVAEAMDLNADNKADKAKIIGMLKVWLSAGSLIVVEDKDEKREIRKFVEVREHDMILPHLTSVPDFCRAPPHTPKGVVVRQLQRPTCPTRAVPQGAAGTAEGNIT